MREMHCWFGHFCKFKQKWKGVNLTTSTSAVNQTSVSSDKHAFLLKASNYHCSWGAFFFLLVFVCKKISWQKSCLVTLHRLSGFKSTVQIFVSSTMMDAAKQWPSDLKCSCRHVPQPTLCCPVINHRTRLATHAFYTSGCIALLNGGNAPKLQLKRRPQSHRDSDIQKDGLSLRWDVDVTAQEEFAWCFQAHVDNDRTSHYFWTPLTPRAAVVVTTTARMQGDAMTNRAKFTYVEDVALEKRLARCFKQRICGKLGFLFIKRADIVSN